MISNLISYFAAEELHITIAPEKLFQIGNISITNSMVYGWFCSLLIIGLLFIASRKMSVGGSRGPVQLIDAGVDFIINTVTNSLGSRKLALKYTPIFAALFFFILLSNWLGLFPGVGHSIQYDGTNFLRPFTADLNGTMAMALFGMIIVQVIAIREIGPKNYAKHYFPGSFLNPATYLIGIFEIFSEFTRLITLGLRLFLNIAVGEILIAVFTHLAGIAGPIAGLPFTLLEIFVGILQAYIFVVLLVAYLSLAVSHSLEEAEETA
ncbi:MAG TPA: FoF1 ATP synthase subunit a [Candidatus Saccharimonadales bacterium]|nr:FoF1 ATP synthase subunit a [Candidatus Saccharimonadales bacterium]